MKRSGLGQQLIDRPVGFGREAGPGQPVGEGQGGERKHEGPKIAEGEPGEADDEGGQHEDGVFPAGEAEAEARGERALVGRTVALEVAEVIDGEKHAGVEADLKAGEQRGGREPAGVEIKRAGHGDHAEEKNDKNFTKPEVGEGKRSAGVKVGAEQRGGADGEDDPAAGQKQRDGQQGGQGEADEAAGHHAAGGQKPRGGDAHRTEALGGVGAFRMVEGIVEVVGRDLDEDGAGEDQAREQNVEVASGRGEGRPDGHGNDCGPEGARAGGENPWAHARSCHAGRGWRSIFCVRMGIDHGGREGHRGGMRKEVCWGFAVLVLAVGHVAAAGRVETMFVESDDPAIPSREVRVWLPPGYDGGAASYPVIYFHDGQNVFRPGGPFGCWLAEDAAEQEMKAGRMREAILVAVGNNPADGGNARVTEYQPPGDVNPRSATKAEGRGDRYGKFLLGQVKPAVDAKFRTLPDAANTVAVGSSMGGLVSLWLGRETEAFGAVGVFSPAFWTSPNFMEAVIGGAKKDGLRIYMDMGTREKGNLTGDYWEDALAVRAALLTQGYVEGEGFLWNPGEGDEHNEEAWAKRLPAALRFLLRPGGS